MAGRRLGPDEAALWARVKASVRPLRTPVEKALISPPFVSSEVETSRASPATRPPTSLRTNATREVQRSIANTLDGGWDKRLTRGIVSPDSTLDLHGHTLGSAHALLDAGIDRAIARGDRVMLLVTGKPPRAGSERPHARGAIRAHVGDWLAGSRHAARIAAVRGAHPRHGGQGALYLVFRRARPTSP